jgi:hypothetical protein
MNKLKHIFVFLLGISQMSFSQITYNESRTFDLEYRISGGYSYLNSSFNNTKEIGGEGLSVGLNGEWTFNANWITQIGGEFSYFNSSISPFNFTEQRNLIDTEGDNFTINYAYSQFSQIQHLGYINLPIGVGYKTNTFYAIAGIKVGFPVYSKYATIIKNLTTDGDYPQFIDNFENMPNHYFISERKDFRDDFSYNKNIVAFARIGHQFDLRSSNPLIRKTFRIGFFANFGLSNLQKYSDIIPLISYGENPVNIHANNMIYTNHSLKNTLHSTIIGIELAFLIRQNTVYRCNCKK